MDVEHQSGGLEMYSNYWYTNIKQKQWVDRGLILIVMFLILMLASGVLHAIDYTADFDHDQTRFPLDLSHARVNCASCHIQKVFLGTPTQCFSCHTNSGRIQAGGPSLKHINTTDDCESCHQAGRWDNVMIVDHFAVLGSCESCHNGRVALGKNTGHVESNNVCDDCHRTISFQGAVYDHSDLRRACIFCHNGVISTGKNPAHMLTTDICDACHRTIAWTPVIRTDHNEVIGSCQNCHNGVIAQGKHTDHVATADNCDVCHTTISWSAVTQNELGIKYPRVASIKPAHEENIARNLSGYSIDDSLKIHNHWRLAMLHKRNSGQ